MTGCSTRNSKSTTTSAIHHCISDSAGICNAGSPTPAHGAGCSETACHSDKDLPVEMGSYPQVARVGQLDHSGRFGPAEQEPKITSGTTH